MKKVVGTVPKVKINRRRPPFNDLVISVIKALLDNSTTIQKDLNNIVKTAPNAIPFLIKIVWNEYPWYRKKLKKALDEKEI